MTQWKEKVHPPSIQTTRQAERRREEPPGAGSTVTTTPNLRGVAYWSRKRHGGGV